MTSVQIAVILAILAISTILLASSLVNQIVPGSPHRISPASAGLHPDLADDCGCDFVPVST